MPDDAVTATAPREAYFIAVTGAMNAAIHNPQWYRTIGAIDETELQAALLVPSNSTTAFLSQVQFGTPPIIVTCQPEQWWIQSYDAKMWPRLLDITALVFARLKETPVTSFGLTSQKHVDTSAPETKSIVAESLWGMNLGLPTGKSTASNIGISVVEEDFTVNASIQPSLLSERAVFLLYQRLYQAPRAPSGYFDIGALLKNRFDKYLTEQERVFGEIVAAVNARAGREKQQ